MKRIRILVADDSLTVRKHLCEILAAVPDFEIVAEAADGQQAVRLCQALRPDVVTLDMAMPVMSGLAATEAIMAECPTPILVVSSSTNRGAIFQTYDALAAGALEVMDKPLANAPSSAWQAHLISTLRMLSRIKVITHPRARLRPASHAAAGGPPARARRQSLVAIGASTGGPAALAQVLGDMPAPSACPMLVVLHLSATFADGLVDWLGGQIPHAVAFARDRQPLPDSGVWLAPAGRHLLLQDGLLRLSNAPERHACRPAVDVLFESLATACGPSTVACLLTGMGRDGAAGLLRIRQAGGTTIAQDEASCVVYGMPREAALLGAAQQVLPLPRIGAALVAATN